LAVDSDGKSGATTGSAGAEGRSGVYESIRGGMGDGIRLEITFGGIGIGRALVEGCICGCTKTGVGIGMVSVTGSLPLFNCGGGGMGQEWPKMWHFSHRDGFHS
jgi:hypothetical protein